MAISTLAPGDEHEDTTNRIQKEIVKQLLYGASEKVGKNSRFSKIAVLGWRRALLEAALAVACVGGLLYLLGWLPDVRWTGAGHSTRAHVVAWSAAGILAALVVGAVRRQTYGRFTVSDVSAGSAAVSLAEKPESFFDKYLDEIVHYFSQESKDIVIFEDLDRFEDPGIFEALRELNILLNETPERRKKRRGNRFGRTFRWALARLSKKWPDKLAAKLPYRWAVRLLGLGSPLRFVYAVRDSVFEKIDGTAAGAGGTGAGAPGAVAADSGVAGSSTGSVVDAAAAETMRANRTKFFDVVIPLVPFISHRNARDLLVELLAERGITGISPRVVNTIAQHCTDMRLMRNMCNEYVVFAERLLEPVAPNKTAPGLSPSRLFALVAYKNFHLGDFENITRRSSDLDRLYEFHQRIVRDTIAEKDARKRLLQAEPERVRTREQVAERLGKRLVRFAEAARRGSNQGWNYIRFKVGSHEFVPADVQGYAFWSAVAQTRALSILVASSETGGQTRSVAALDHAGLEEFATEGLQAHRWLERDAAAVQNELVEIEQDIAALRRADFEDLAAMPRFTLAPETDAATAASFSDLLEDTIKSKLACDLVRRGYIDRNFSLYAAQFYGNFTGIDVATFMVQHVQTNTMAVHYDLRRDGAVSNLLAEAEEAGEEIEHSVAAYNIDIVNHLLADGDRRVGDVVDNLIAGWAGPNSRTFLAAFFTSESAQREAFAAVLAEHGWREVFTYLVADPDVPSSVRPALVSAAMCAFDPHVAYELGDTVREFITTHYAEMSAFTETHPADTAQPQVEQVAERLDVLLGRAGVVISKLDVVRDGRLRQLVVGANRYDLSAENLRTALSTTSSVSLDHVRENAAVYDYCLTNPVAYVNVVGQDSKTSHTVEEPGSLVNLLNDVGRRWSEDPDAEPSNDELAGLLAGASSDASVSSLRDVPQSTWTVVAAAGLFRVSLANVEDYRTYAGSVDTHLAALLQSAGIVHVEESGDTRAADGSELDRQVAAAAILNTAELDTALRVRLAASIQPAVPLPAESITASADDLFALLLEHKMVADDEATFAHFRAGGWPAFEPAIRVSKGIATFINPELVDGMVADLLGDRASANKVGRSVLAEVDAYVPRDDWMELRAVAVYADTRQAALAPDTVLRIARSALEKNAVNAKRTLRLLCAAIPPASADQVLEVFSLLRKPYADITRSGEKFKLDRDTLHEQLLKVLKDANRISMRASGGHFNVTVL